MSAEFHPAPWARGPHVQTLWAQFTRSRRLARFRRESLTTPDGDELLLDHAPGPIGSPRLLILHGLEGSSFSPYAQGMMFAAQRQGFRATVLNFRTCARRLDDTKTWIPNRRPRLYHSGETTDLDHILTVLHESEPEVPIIAFGVSLGGNVLLKWLGEHPEQELITAAATLSVPYDLAVCAETLQGASHRIYLHKFLRTLRAKMQHLSAVFPEVRERVDLESVNTARNLIEFDDAATAPLHGFRDAYDYYDRSSSSNFVGRIETPTLCISAADDPFSTRQVSEAVRELASAAVTPMITDQGGHVGFVDRLTDRRDLSWAEARALAWLADHI